MSRPKLQEAREASAFRRAALEGRGRTVLVQVDLELLPVPALQCRFGRATAVIRERRLYVRRLRPLSRELKEFGLVRPVRRCQCRPRASTLPPHELPATGPNRTRAVSGPVDWSGQAAASESVRHHRRHRFQQSAADREPVAPRWPRWVRVSEPQASPSIRPPTTGAAVRVYVVAVCGLAVMT